jgi:hypothetical protein
MSIGHPPRGDAEAPRTALATAPVYRRFLNDARRYCNGLTTTPGLLEERPLQREKVAAAQQGAGCAARRAGYK